MPPRQRFVTNKKIDPKSLLRLMKYVFKRYSWRLLLVAVCIIISADRSIRLTLTGINRSIRIVTSHK